MHLTQNIALHFQPNNKIKSRAYNLCHKPRQVQSHFKTTNTICKLYISPQVKEILKHFYSKVFIILPLTMSSLQKQIQQQLSILNRNDDQTPANHLRKQPSEYTKIDQLCNTVTEDWSTKFIPKMMHIAQNAFLTIPTGQTGPPRQPLWRRYCSISLHLLTEYWFVSGHIGCIELELKQVQ